MTGEGKIKRAAQGEKTGSDARPENHNPNEAAFVALIRTYGLVRRAAEPYFAQFGISASQWAVLRVLSLARNEGLPSLRAKDLGERLLIRPPSVTGVVDRLERMGLVVRDLSATDMRVKQVRITDKGKQLVEKVLQFHAGHIKMILDGLSTDQQEELRRLLERLAERLELALHEHQGIVADGAVVFQR